MIGIYKIINIITKDIYIGKSINIEKRFNDHMSELRNNKKTYNEFFQRSFNKYKKYNFKLELIEECSESELNKREIYWINYFRQNYPYRLYNISDGGDGGKMPQYIIDKTRIKISKANKGNEKLSHKGSENPMFGKKHSEETKKKISEHKKGKPSWTLGKHLSEDTKQKLRKANLGKKHSEETRKKMSESAKCRDNEIYRHIWTDEFCNEIRNLHLVGLSFYQLQKLLGKNAETIRHSIRKYEIRNNLPNSSNPYLMIN